MMNLKGEKLHLLHLIIVLVLLLVSIGIATPFAVKSWRVITGSFQPAIEGVEPEELSKTLDQMKQSIEVAQTRQKTNFSQFISEDKVIPQDDEGKEEKEAIEEETNEPTILVLNGKGVPGLAGQLSASLKEAGFSQVSVGNSGLVKKTVVYYKEDVKESLVASVLKVVEADFPKAESVQQETDYSQDLVIILGQD